MASYTGVFKCGHEGKVNALGPTKIREYNIEMKFSGLCPECYKKMKEEENKKLTQIAKEKAEQFELVELEGSEKQISWALRIRMEMIEKFLKWVEEEGYKSRFFGEEKKYRTKETVMELFDYLLLKRTRASFWIDQRSSEIQSLLNNELEFYLEEKKAEQEEEMEEEHISVVKPDKMLYPGAAKIYNEGDYVLVKYEKNDAFRKIVKSLGYSWEYQKGSWKKKLTEKTGSYEERAGELGNKLLISGFAIKSFEEKILEKASTGEYEPECKNWVINIKGDYVGLRSEDERIFKVAMQLPKATYGYHEKAVKVGLMHYRNIAEFAKEFDFKYTKMARNKLNSYILEMERGKSVEPTEKESIDMLEQILHSSSEILEDLKDE